jgi:hypothetical protein
MHQILLRLYRISAAIPEDLKALADRFMSKVRQGTEQTHATGYGGSGFQFNREEEECEHLATDRGRERDLDRGTRVSLARSTQPPPSQITRHSRHIIPVTSQLQKEIELAT